MRDTITMHAWQPQSCEEPGPAMGMDGPWISHAPLPGRRRAPKLHREAFVARQAFDCLSFYWRHSSGSAACRHRVAADRRRLWGRRMSRPLSGAASRRSRRARSRLDPRPASRLDRPQGQAAPTPEVRARCASVQVTNPPDASNGTYPIQAVQQPEIVKTQEAVRVIGDSSSFAASRRAQCRCCRMRQSPSPRRRAPAPLSRWLQSADRCRRGDHHMAGRSGRCPPAPCLVDCDGPPVVQDRIARICIVQTGNIPDCPDLNCPCSTG